jgi:hypothetical protein
MLTKPNRRKQDLNTFIELHGSLDYVVYAVGRTEIEIAFKLNRSSLNKDWLAQAQANTTGKMIVRPRSG